jgi:O-acetyl-ADP-ribose deacetylase (regulator of RNase III)
MIRIQEGDIFKTDVEAIVNTVNCVGVMGRGVALQFKKLYPDNFTKYKAVCDRGELAPGNMLVHETGRVVGPRYVINFPTKRHWRGKSRLEDVRDGLAALLDVVRDLGIRSIALPPLGCGLGGLQWVVVRPMIERAFSELPEVDAVLFAPRGAPDAARMVREERAPNMTEGRATLLLLMERYLRAAMDPFVTLLELHKLMYFMQLAGQELRLDFKKALYGPYAENLRHVLNKIEGHFLTGYADGEDDPRKPLELKEGITRQAHRSLSDQPKIKGRIDRVSSLIDGFETPFGMELLATVHWVAAKEGAGDLRSVTEGVHRWNPRKRMFQARHIHLAWETLGEQGWLGSDGP